MPGVKGQNGPLYLKCSKCKLRRNEQGTALTGRLFRTGRERGAGVQLKCVDCGHVGWYTHDHAARKPLLTS
jgi:hypothetical protein